MAFLKIIVFSFAVTYLICLPENTLAQYRYKRFTYFGCEIGTKSEIYQLKDNGTELYRHRSFERGLSGFFLEQELNRWISAGTGIYFSRYGTDFRFHRDDGVSTFPSMRTIMIPLRLQVTIPIYYGIPEIRVKPGIGLSGIANKSQSVDSIFGKIAPVLSDQYTGTVRYDFRNFYWLAEAGLHLEMLFAKGIIASLSTQYHMGFANVAQTSINYRIDKKTYQGSLTSKGDFFNISLSVKYPISRLWKSRSGN